MMEEITVYTSPTCPWCSKVKEYLNGKGVNYREVNVATDFNAAQKMMDTTGQRGVPVITKGSEYIVGFDRERIDSMLQ
jgi:glutaredoxin 3